MKKIITIILAIATLFVACETKKTETPVVSSDSTAVADSVPAPLDSSLLLK